MSLLNDLVKTIGLDNSFFYQLVLAVVLYFVLKRLFLQAYLESFEKRQKLTKGRMKSSKELGKEIEESKALYEKKAKLVHERFQEVFSKIKQKAQEDYLKEFLQMRKEQKELVTREKKSLNQALKKQSDSLEKEIPLLTKLLVEKIKS